MARAAPYADGDILRIGETDVRLRVSPRARRVSLKIDSVRREAIATAPTPRRLAEAAGFATERASWIADQLARLPVSPPLAEMTVLRLFGEPHAIVRTGLRARLEPAAEGAGPTLVLPADPDRAPGALARLLKRQAAEVLAARTAVYCARLDRPVPRVLVADPKSRWGSCRPPGGGQPAAIRYSWRLALAPFAVADYVAAHECAHLVEANHSPRFWAVVKSLCGDPAPHRAWLRTHGAGLHAFGR